MKIAVVQVSLAAFFIVFTCTIRAQVTAPQDLLRDQIYSALTGDWTGQIEYRDYQSDERVVLPTWLEVKPTSAGDALQFAYTYDDGPTKTVTEMSTVIIDTTKRQFTIVSSGDHSTNTYGIEGLGPPNRNGRMRFALTGDGTEKNQKVQLRITITIDRNLYQFTKETRLPGAEFNFRDSYQLTRRNPPH
jgi:hypothetical protein